MPRNAGVSGRTTTRFIVFSPNDRTIDLCFSGQQIVLPISLILIQLDLSFVILNLIQAKAAHLRYLGLVAQLLERVDGRFHDIVRIVGAD
jgi:hypothetical protein